jgi:hypothetical protein
VHDHYWGRPFGLQEMCLAEFAITYTRARRKHTDGMHDGMSKHTGQLLSFNNGEPLPRSIISRHGDKEIHMSLRSHRVVLRIHKFKDQSNQEEHLYSEMLMFMPWNDKILDLHANNTEEIIHTFAKPETLAVIKCNKCSVFPYHAKMADIEQFLAVNPDVHAGHTYDHINPEGEMENEEAAAEGTHEDLEYMFLDPSLVEGQEEEPVTKQQYNQESASVLVARPVVSLNELSDNIRLHSTDQHMAFTIVLDFVRQLVKNPNAKLPRPHAPLLMIHGGAGTGKSLLINSLADMTEHLLRQDAPFSPEELLALGLM